MSGNTTQTGSRIGQWQLGAAVPSLIAIICFVIGVFGGALLHHAKLVQARRLAFGLVALLIGAVIGMSGVGFQTNNVHIATLSLAMGIMNTTITQVGAQPVNIGFVTGTLNAMATHLALAVRRVPPPDTQGPWDSHAHRALVLFGIWGSFFGGALLAGIASSQVGFRLLVPPFIVLIGLAAVGERPAESVSTTALADH